MHITDNRKKINLANVLTTLRILLTPVCILFIIWNIPNHRLIALIIFILASLTDAFDGYLARIRGEITSFGKFYDPLADKILILSVLIVLAFDINKAWCWWAVGILCFREGLVALLRRRFARQGVSVEPNSYGKIKACIQIIAVGGLILQTPVAPYLLWISVIFSIFSGLYYVNAWKIRPQSILTHNPPLQDDIAKDGRSNYH